MNVEWTVVTVIVVIVGLIISVATPLVKSTKAMAELTVNLRVLNEHLEKMDDQNRNEHKYLLDHLDEHDEKLAEHETRITLIEHTGK